MKVKNVIKGLSQKYDLEEITIIDSDRVCFRREKSSANWFTVTEKHLFLSATPATVNRKQRKRDKQTHSTH